MQLDRFNSLTLDRYILLAILIISLKIGLKKSRKPHWFIKENMPWHASQNFLLHYFFFLIKFVIKLSFYNNDVNKEIDKSRYDLICLKNLFSNKLCFFMFCSYLFKKSSLSQKDYIY